MYKQFKPIASLLALMALVALFTTSCFDPPVYSISPVIEMQNIVYVDVPDGTTAKTDSLIVTVSFKDGDGDLGLSTNEIDAPFNEKYYFALNSAENSTSKLNSFSEVESYILNGGKVITYATKRTNPNYDSLPAYGCANWETDTLNNVLDTVYFQKNKNYYNIFVDFYVKRNDGKFDTVNWDKLSCVSFDGRYPILSKDLSRQSPLDGKIQYSMMSTGFNILFSIKTIKIAVTIQDRAFHRSNRVETQEFTLQQIKKSG